MTVKRKIAVTIVAAVVLFSIAIAPVAVSAYAFSGKPTVVIDAGHGGEDGGVVGTKTGVKESDLNLFVSKLVGEYLGGAGFKVVYTRSHKGSLIGGSFDKRKDMDERVRIINAAKPSAAVSLHMNSYPGTSRRGAQTFFYSKNEESRRLADTVQSFLNSELNLPDTGREYAALSAEKYLFWKTSCPLVIVECGFLSNPIDENNLSSDAYRHELAYTVFRGIVAYLSACGV